MFEIIQYSEFRKVADFIAKLNIEAESFCLHCGETSATVLEDMLDKHKRNELYLFKWEEKGAIKAVFGGECDEDGKRFWLWGPFIDKPEDWFVIAERLYEHLWQLFPDIEKLYTYNDEANVRAYRFFQSKDFAFKDENTFLYEIVAENVSSESSEIEVINFNSAYFESLNELHNKAFPNTYYTTKEMTELNQVENQLWIIPQNNTAISGYILASKQPEGGYIHFVAVHEAERKKGYATALMQKAILWLFNEKKVPAVFLTVVESNNAKRLYQKLGFTLKYTGVAARLILEKPDDN